MRLYGPGQEDDLAVPQVAPPIKKALPPPKGEFEKYEYPYIKWKPRMLPSGAIVQLETTMSPSGNGRFRFAGQVKYILRVLIRGNAIIPVQGLRIELIDEKGFGLTKFVVPANEFVAVTGTSVVEARGIWPSSEEDYRSSVDYVVK
jgi:hypothetical protein